MAFNLEATNRRAESDPAAWIAACDREYQDGIEKTALKIIDNLPNSPIVLLSGPSASGKTTTAMKLRDELSRRGVNSHSISMDNYFQTFRQETIPRTESGLPDFESPECLDMELLNEQFTRLTRGETIYVPRYEFARRMRSVEPSQSLCLGKNEVAIFEGIHALNDDITTVHPEAFKFYISPNSGFVDGSGRVLFDSSWLRLVRRVTRDSLFRGYPEQETMRLWSNVRLGEKRYIEPFRGKANVQMDTAFAYEVCVLRQLALPLFFRIPEDAAMREEILAVAAALELFVPVDPALLQSDAMLREFIGGGIYKY